MDAGAVGALAVVVALTFRVDATAIGWGGIVADGGSSRVIVDDVIASGASVTLVDELGADVSALERPSTATDDGAPSVAAP